MVDEEGTSSSIESVNFTLFPSVTFGKVASSSRRTLDLEPSSFTTIMNLPPSAFLSLRWVPEMKSGHDCRTVTCRSSQYFLH